MHLTNELLQECEMTGFDSERLRKTLLRTGRVSELLKTYNAGVPCLPDGNSGKYWDERFSQARITHHMELHRNQLVTGLIKQKFRSGEIVTLVDLGVGRGDLEEMVSNKIGRQISITGTDITRRTLNRLREKFPYWRFIYSRLFPVKLTNESADLVVLLEVLEHIKPESTFQVLSEIYRIVRKNKYFIVSVPVNEGLEDMSPSNPNHHMRVYEEDLLRFELEHSGFEVMKVFYLSAFSTHYRLKTVLNSILRFRHPNNLVILARKKSA